jgi:peptide/nickel transport system substrate-binding protein
MTIPFRRLLALGVVPLAGLLTACASSTAAPATSGNEQPVSGGTYVHALEAEPGGCLDGPQLRYHVALNIVRQATDSLVDIDPETGKIVPWLATKWQVSDDAKTFTFTLRDDVTFSNGEKFDATAVKLNLDRDVALGAKATGAGPVLAGYVGTEVVNAQTAKVTFSKPNIQFLQGLSDAWLGIISPSDTKKSAAELCTGAYSGTGPFVIDTYTVDSSVELHRRDGYAWPSATAKHTGDAYLDKLTFTFVPESGVRAGSLQSGQVNSVSLVQPQDEPVLKSAGLGTLVATPPGLVQTWIANQQSTLGGDAAVRKAISYALDRQQLTTLYGSGFAPATGLLSPNTPYFTDLSKYIVHDPEVAKKTLDDAGWKVGSDGIREKNGVKLSLNVVNVFPEQAELLQQQLKQVGIDYRIRKLDNASSAKAISQGDYDFYVWNMTRADPDVLRGIFSSAGGAQGYARAKPSAADAPLAAQAGATDSATRQKLVDQASTELVTSYVGIPQLTRAWVYGYGKNVHGFSVDGEAKLVFYDTWLSA